MSSDNANEETGKVRSASGARKTESKKTHSRSQQLSATEMDTQSSRTSLAQTQSTTAKTPQTQQRQLADVSSSRAAKSVTANRQSTLSSTQSDIFFTSLQSPNVLSTEVAHVPNPPHTGSSTGLQTSTPSVMNPVPLSTQQNISTSSASNALPFGSCEKSSNSSTLDIEADTPIPRLLKWQNIEATAILQPSLVGRLFCGKKPTEKVLLKGVSGKAKNGELTYLMGNSGSGKTTLLNILTERQSKKILVNGKIIVNDEVLPAGMMKRISAYVPQDDLFIQYLTVRETLEIMLRLRFPSTSSTDGKNKRRKLNQIMREFGLLDCADTLVGGHFVKSISRGEKKRLAIACELLADADILFCDEPTSGLDAYMSYKIMKLLKKQAKLGKTVICTIHQPSSFVFDLANRLILIWNGHKLFNGRTSKIEKFFADRGYPLPSFVSLPDHFIYVINKRPDEDDDAYSDRMNRLLDMQSSASLPSNRDISQRPSLADANKYLTSYTTQYYYLMRRSFMVIKRHKFLLTVRCIQTILTAIIISSVYFQENVTYKNVRNPMAIAYCTQMDLHVTFMISAVMTFLNDVPAVKREYQSAMYHPGLYFIAKTSVDICPLIMCGILYTTIVYFITGLPLKWFSIVIFYMTRILMVMMGVSVGYAGGAVFGDVKIVAGFIMIILLPIGVVSGFFIDIRSIPIYFRWLTYISWYRYNLHASVVAIYSSIDQIHGCPSNATTLMTMQCSEYSTGPEYLLRGLGYSNSTMTMWVDFLAIFLAMAFFRIVGLVAFVLRITK